MAAEVPSGVGRYRWQKWREPNKRCGELLMEMERFDEKAKEGEQGAVGRLFERVSLPVVWASATHFSFPWKIFRVLCGYFEHQRREQFEGCVAEPLETITAILPGSK